MKAGRSELTDGGVGRYRREGTLQSELRRARLTELGALGLVPF